MDYKKDEEDGVRNPFVGLEKSAVLQEARTFNDMPIKARKCVLILTKLLFLINQGDTFGTREATETFFSMTKLFQHKDVTMRRMVYLTIKAMSTISEDVIMVTSSLMKDMTNKDDTYRAAAIRALCTITDSTTLQSLERYLKQAIVDRNPNVSSAALVSSLHLMRDGQDVVKRWVNEVQQAVSAHHNMTQYHALGLLYHIKQKDRLAVQKLVSTHISGHTLRSNYAYCLLIRYASKLLDQDDDSSHDAMYNFLESCLRHKSDMVIYEAARAIVNIKDVSARQIGPAVSVLHLFLSSPRPVLRFAAVRTLNKVSLTHPNALKVCLIDLESLITDTNRSVATLAITTLLKTGTEASVERLMKQISSFMHEISDEFKIVVVEAIRSLCIKFPQKYPLLMSFLSSALRDSGEEAYKRAIVNSIAVVVGNVPEAKEAGLAHLCEYIEDCEYNDLLTNVLHMLGDMGPSTSNPSKYIRFIYNRVILETSSVRAAAVDALCKFGLQCDSLRESIVILLRRFLLDGDDEVRDRVVFSLALLGGEASPAAIKDTPLVLPTLERALQEYIASPSDSPFDLKTVPIDTGTIKPTDDMFEVADDTPAAATVDVRAETEARLLAVPELSGLGSLFKSSAPVMLTEAETEYNVRCTKHVLGQHIVFEYRIVNTLNDQVLENAEVAMEGGEQEIDADDIVIVKAARAAYDVPAFAYVAFPASPLIASQTFETRLDFVVKDCDPETGECDEEGYDDTYALEDIELAMSDFMQPFAKPNFAAAWAEMEGQSEATETFALSSLESISQAVETVMEFLGMAPCERSNRVDEDKTSHTLLLSGIFVGQTPVLVRARLALDDGVNMELSVRSENEELTQLIVDAVA